MDDVPVIVQLPLIFIAPVTATNALALRVVLPPIFSDPFVNVTAAFAVKLLAPEQLMEPLTNVSGEPILTEPALMTIVPPELSVVVNVDVLNTVAPLENVKDEALPLVMFMAAPRLKVLPTTVIVLVLKVAAVVTVLPLLTTVAPLTVNAVFKVNVGKVVVPSPIVNEAIVMVVPLFKVGWLVMYATLEPILTISVVLPPLPG
jgi:hypothetical protein